MSNPSEKISPSERILTTAFEYLSKEGYANVTMRGIADEAGVALSQLTYYYKSKENLFLEVINKMTGQYLDQIEATLQARTSPQEKIGALIGFFKDLITEKPNLLKIFIDFTAQALWIPSFRKQLDDFFVDLTKTIENNLLDIPIKTGSQPNLISKQIAMLICGALYGTSVQALIGTDLQNSFESLFLIEKILNIV